MYVDPEHMMRSHEANSRPDGRAYLRLSAVQICRSQNTFRPRPSSIVEFLKPPSLYSNTVFSCKFMEMLFMKRLIYFMNI